MLKSSFIGINSKRSIHISPSLNILSMEALKRSKDDSDNEDTSVAIEPTSNISPASKKRKVDSDKPEAAKAVGKPKQDGELDPRVANVPLFESNMQFPDQLWHLLKYDELKEAIWWLPGNDAFAINEPNFSELLLESHFRKNKFTSIIRKLNRWGYRKFVDRSLPPKTVAYYHRSFQKGRLDLLKSIEKEEGKPISTTSGDQSHYSLFPEATTSHGIMAQMRQPNNPLPGLLGVTGMSILDPSQGAMGASRLGSSEMPSAGISARRMSSLDTTGITTLGTPLNQRQHSGILHSIFGQRGSGGLPAIPLVAGMAPSPSLARSSLVPSPANRSRELLRLSNLELSLAQQRTLLPAESTLDRQTLLESMVGNIERERQYQQHDGLLLQALRQRRQSVAEEQKQEADDANLLSLISSNRGQSLLELRHQERRRQLLQQEVRERRLSQEQKQEASDVTDPSYNANLLSAMPNQGIDEANLYSIMSHRRRQSLLQMQERQQPEVGILAAREDVLRSTQLLEAAERQRLGRASLGNQFQLHRQLQAAIASPNLLLTNPMPSTGRTRSVLGQEIPGDLLLSPQQRVREQIRMLQLQQQMEDSLQRDSNAPQGN